MLQFAKGAPLGEKGLDWLKIHLVTLHGAQKKASLEERLQYAEKIMDDILDSANNPLTVSELQHHLNHWSNLFYVLVQDYSWHLAVTTELNILQECYM